MVIMKLIFLTKYLQEDLTSMILEHNQKLDRECLISPTKHFIQKFYTEGRSLNGPGERKQHAVCAKYRKEHSNVFLHIS